MPIYKSIALDLEDEYLNGQCQEEAPNFLECLSDYHLQEIGKGCHRTTFSDRREYVYKIGDPHSNKTEFNFYNKAPRKVKRILAKSLYLSTNCFIHVMEYVPNQISKKDRLRAIKRFEELVTVSDIDKNAFYFDIYNPENLRKTPEGKIKLIDYEKWRSPRKTCRDFGWDVQLV